MKKILTGFCFTDIHNQQSMLDYPVTLRKSLIQAKKLAMEEFGLADAAIVDDHSGFSADQFPEESALQRELTQQHGKRQQDQNGNKPC